MSSTILTIIGLVVAVIGITARIIFWVAGKNSVKAKQEAKDAEILKRQRDNDVTSVAESDSVWNDIRDK